MAEGQYYAQTEINTGDKVVAAGTKVNKADFKDGWDQLVNSGAVSTDEYVETPVGGVVGDIVTAEERESMEAAIQPEEGAVRARSRT